MVGKKRCIERDYMTNGRLESVSIWLCKPNTACQRADESRNMMVVTNMLPEASSMENESKAMAFGTRVGDVECLYPYEVSARILVNLM